MKKPFGSTSLLIFCVLASGCGEREITDRDIKPYPEMDRLDVERSFYSSEEECAKSWRKEDCEKVHTGNSEGRGGGHAWFYGPYFSRNGTVYGYDGNIYKRDPSHLPSSRLGNTVKSVTSIEGIHSTQGAYASTPKVALSPAARAMTARSAHSSSIAAGSRAVSVSGRGAVGGGHGSGGG